jgi:hypothetical protein
LNFNGLDPSTLSYLIWETENEKHDMAKKMKMLEQKLEIMKNCLPESKTTSLVQSNLGPTPNTDQKPEILSQLLPPGDQTIIGRLPIIESVEDIQATSTGRRQSYNRQNSTKMPIVKIQESPLDPEPNPPSTLLENLSSKIKNSLTQKSKKLRLKKTEEETALNQNSSRNLFQPT